MSKELEAFERVWEDCSQFDLDYVSKHNLMDDLREIEQALTPPTEEEVCKALSEYLKPHYTRNVKVTFENNEFVFFERRIVQYVGGNIWFNLPIDFPPHLITMLSRFFEGKVKE